MAMGKFWSVVENVIDESDFVIEVLDARMPELTRNKKAEKLVKKKRKILILVANKADFVSEETIELYKKKFEKIPFFFVSIRDRRGVTLLKRKLFEIVEKKSKSYMINISVIGYPNTGKSSLINALCGRKKLRIGSKPGRTKGYQWIRVGSNIRFIDTPGVIPLSDADEVKQILMNTLDPSKSSRVDDAAKEIVKIFLKQNRKAFENMYKIDTRGKTFKKIVKEIGESKKMMIKGGKIDERRVHLKIIDDWQKGKLLLKN
jgi:ribosome biogenesis GTPase A